MSENNSEKQTIRNIRGKYSIIPLKEYEPVSYSETLSGKGYVFWGKDNNFPEYLWSTYMTCSTLQSILNGYIDYTCGNEIINNTTFKGENSVGDTLQDVCWKVIRDLWVYGGFSVQVIYNEFGNFHELIYLDIQRIRISEDYSQVYVIEDFKKFGMHTRISKDITFDAFGTLSQEERSRKGTEVFYYKGRKSKGYYPVCDYISAITSAETQIEIKRFHYNNISNGMLSATIINFNNADDVSDEAKEQIEEGLKRKFGGPGGAGEFVVSWNEDKDHEVSIQKLDDDNFDSKFSKLAEDTRDDLFISLRATPQLFGLSLSTGFNSQEFEEAFQLSNRTTIAPKQKEIQRCFDKIFKMGEYAPEGISDIQSIEFVPFTLNTNTSNGEGTDS